ncbi:MAG: hypothetical protein FWE98_02405 [Oscillospiraceae bacterium]|nr:hypothetical protein [Oscillospiraceae bacterium]
MKRINVCTRAAAVACAALLLAALAAGCGRDPAPAALTTVDDTAWLSDFLTEPTTGEATGEIDETLPEGVYSSIVYYTQAPTTVPGATTPPGATTTKIPTLSGNATTTKPPATTKAPGNTTIPSATTTRPPATAAPTTTRAATTGGTQHYPGGISIASQAEALSRFNAAVKTALDSKAGYNKSHMINPKAWVFDPAFIDDVTIPGLGGLVNMSEQISGWLNTALGATNGAHTATCAKGQSSNLMKNSQFAMGDLTDATYSGSQGGEWTVTLFVKDGQTRQEKRLLGSGISGNSPIDKGPIHMATGDGGLYDHMSADRVFALVKSSNLSVINVDPIDISESTTGVKFTARIDGEGKLLELRVTYNQTINLTEIRILNGADTYRNNTGSSTVTVTYDQFVY